MENPVTPKYPEEYVSIRFAQQRKGPIKNRIPVRLRTSAFAMAFVTGLSFSGNAWACQGQNLERTTQVIDFAWQAGLETAYMNDLNLQLQKLMDVSFELASVAQQLPPSCQAIIRQWSGAIEQVFSGRRYNGCQSGVCCDDSGCF